MTYGEMMNNESFTFEVTVTGVPKGICRKIIDEAFRLYTEKYEDEMDALGENEYRLWNDEMFEVCSALIGPLIDETGELEKMIREHE
jgi:hypothetical protein